MSVKAQLRHQASVVELLGHNAIYCSAARGFDSAPSNETSPGWALALLKPSMFKPTERLVCIQGCVERDPCGRGPELSLHMFSLDGLDSLLVSGVPLCSTVTAKYLGRNIICRLGAQFLVVQMSRSLEAAKLTRRHSIAICRKNLTKFLGFLKCGIERCPPMCRCFLSDAWQRVRHLFEEANLHYNYFEYPS